MKNLGKTFMKVRREMNIALAVSLILVGCIEFWWRHYPAIGGWSDADRMADIVTNLLLAYVASWIFFFVNDHWVKEEQLSRGRASVFDALFEMSMSLVMLSYTDREGRTVRVFPNGVVPLRLGGYGTYNAVLEQAFIQATTRGDGPVMRQSIHHLAEVAMIHLGRFERNDLALTEDGHSYYRGLLESVKSLQLRDVSDLEHYQSLQAYMHRLMVVSSAPEDLFFDD